VVKILGGKIYSGWVAFQNPQKVQAKNNFINR